MRLTALSVRQVVLCCLALATGSIAAVQVRRSLNPYAAAFPVAGIWLASIALVVAGAVIAVRAQWRTAGTTLVLVGASLLIGFGITSAFVAPSSLTMEPVVEGPIVRVQLRSGTGEDQVRGFLCEFVYSDCVASSGKTFRVGIIRIIRVQPNQLVIVTTPEYQQNLLRLVQGASVVESAEIGSA